ncbi:YwqJ-related putative deaminase [Listeria booriae]|uniref:YwqJ-related putative deaminase n=1 Tax=Listeria booriae TaxID=1552123 RepID=UPI0021AB9108|nr:YwqJ-related putative deaminase [Listeria booriae]
MSEESQSYVVAGALLKCDKAEGSQGCYLNLKASHGVYTTDGLAQCHVGDRKVPENISTFGTCSVDGKKCVPVLPLDWLEGKQDALIDGKPGLISGCHLQCMRGEGKIVVAEDGQGESSTENQISNPNQVFGAGVFGLGTRPNGMSPLIVWKDGQIDGDATIAKVKGFDKERREINVFVAGALEPLPIIEVAELGTNKNLATDEELSSGEKKWDVFAVVAASAKIPLVGKLLKPVKEIAGKSRFAERTLDATSLAKEVAEVHLRINLRRDTVKYLEELKATGIKKKELGPAVASVLHKPTGQIYHAINDFSGAVPNLHATLDGRLIHMPKEVKELYSITKGAGSHAEVIALNKALLAHPNAKMDDFMINVIRTGTNRKKPLGMMFPRCPHCLYLTDGFKTISEVEKGAK